VPVDFLLRVFAEHRDAEAIIWQDRPFTYGWLADRVSYWDERLATQGLPRGAVAILEADFSPNAVALFLALARQSCILVPLTSAVEANKAEFVEIAEGEFRFCLDEQDEVRVSRLPHTASHPLYQELRRLDHPGLALFSSGSTGKSKATLHDLIRLLEKFKVRRKAWRAISFLLYDHIGGLNTLFQSLANAGCLVTVAQRDPDAVLAAVARHRVELLPTSPTFINLMLLSEAWKRHDLRTLTTVSYGTEPMPESTLRRLHELFPAINLVQTYGLSEVGVLRSKSKRPDSLWVKLGGEGFATRVVEGILHIKAQSAMLGYLNAPSPFTADGWLNTGDAVEVEGDYFRILGRKSELINVGGEKVYPAEVEAVLLEMENVADAAVYAEPNAILGQTVAAQIRTRTPVAPREFIPALKKFCASRLQPYKIPVRVRLVDTALHSERFKKMRRYG
jgi:acyl-coenzyme A synthetase/AMP-(fatty) acid ligase